MWNEGGLWRLRIRTRKVNLLLPLPLYVLDDLLESLEDLGQVILPRLGMPNYVLALREAIMALADIPPDCPLVAIQTGEFAFECRRIGWGGH